MKVNSMQSNFSIQAKKIGKVYQLYNNAMDRLKQALWRGRKKYYREFSALADITFDIKKGETIGIIGSNGSGKSTLLQMICGILTPTYGNLYVEGRVAALLELGAGFNPEFSGRENIYMNAAIMGLSRREIDDRYDKIIAFADIGEFIEQPVKSYSSGMYVRLAFAAAINVSPDILIVDEALAVGDVRFQQKCLAKIKKFCETGTVIFVSHDTTTVTELCSRVLWIEGGRLVMDGSPKMVVEKYLQFMYEGSETINQVQSVELPAQAPGTSLNNFLTIDSSFRQFGNGSAVIKAVRMVSSESENRVMYSGKPCKIGIVIHAGKEIINPIVGFIVKDRLGREILGDNSSLIMKTTPGFTRDQKVIVEFTLNEWPNLQEGDYTLSIAVADGMDEEHAQCHWVHDAVVFSSIPVRKPAGILSVPDTKVKITTI